MTIAALSWPAASIYIAMIVSVAFVAAVLIHSIFRTGQTAIKKEGGQQERLESLRREVDELRARLQQLIPPTEPEARA